MLSDLQCRQARPAARPYRLPDAGGLYLWVTPASKSWRWRYRLQGRESILTLGRYPDVGLSEARRRRDAARTLVAQGRNPASERAERAERERAQARETFAALAADWLASRTMTPAARAARVRALDRYALPLIGERPAREVTPAEVLAAVRAARAGSGPHVAANLREWISAVYRFGIPLLRCEQDPAAALRGAVTLPPAEHARPLSASALGDFLRRLRAARSGPAVIGLIEFLLLTLARGQEARGAVESEIDRPARLWAVPAERMKMRRPHLVPLAPRALALVDALAPLRRGPMLFPGRGGSRPDGVGVGALPGGLSRMTVNRAIERMGYAPGEITAHDLRATGSTHLLEMGWSAEWVEVQLAHAQGAVAAAYNHALYLEGRRAMLEAWAARLGELEGGG